MNQPFLDYLSSVGMASPLVARVAALEHECKLLTPEEITHYFVSEVIQQDATRQYLTLCFFTNHYVFELENFVSQPRLWIAKLDHVENCECEAMDFDFASARESSRLNAVLRWAGLGYTLDLKASGQNCMQLVRVVKACIFKGR
jgi:hypothetical protein